MCGWLCRRRDELLSPAGAGDGGVGMVGRARTNRRGVALLVVLLGLALMTLIVVDFASESGLGFALAANQSNEVRAYYLARSAIGVGLALLAQSARIQAMSQSQQIADTLQDVWAVP